MNYILNMAKKVIISEKQFRGLFEEQIAVNYDNPLSIDMCCGHINEGLVKTYPFETMLRYVTEYFNIPLFYVHSYDNNGIMCVAFDVPKDERFQKRFDKAMNLCGYFQSIKSSLDDFDRIHYEPKFEDEEIYVGEFLYHITKMSYLDKIKEIGLCPYHKNTFFNFPSRIYFFKEDTPFDYLKQATERLYAYSNKEHNDGKYAVLKIAVDKLPNNMKFYADPNIKNGLYTTNNIPPQCIMDEIEMIDVSTT